MNFVTTDRTPNCPDGPRVDPRSESGIALIAVMMVGLVIIAMGVLAFQLSNTALNQSTRQIRREQLVHLAEHGIDQTLARLTDNQNYSYYPTGPTGLSAYPGPFASAQAEKAWVRTAFQNTNLAVGTTPQGEYAIIKPAGANVVYSASWIPSRAAAAGSPRILKVEYLLSSYSPQSAALTSGNLTINGSVVISGDKGTAHTNSDMEINGNPTTEGLTASGTAQAPAVGGQTPQAVPKINPRTMYEARFDPSITANWHDLCPNGEVRGPAALGADPCTGTLLEADASTVPFRGWTLSSNNWTFNDNNSSYAGVYYVYQKGVKVSGSPGTPASPWRTTILAQAAEDALPAGSDCALHGHDHGFGDIEISGSPTITPFIDGLGLMAGRDLKISGSSKFPIASLLAAHEQIGIVGGSPVINGALVAQDVCDTLGSPVNNNLISGSVTITLNSDFEVTLPAALRTALWIEL